MTQISNLEYEKKFMKDFIGSIKVLKPILGKKLELTGALVEILAKELSCESDQLFFAGYYANIGLLMLEDVINKPHFIDNDKERELIKQHVHYSADFLEKRGFVESAKIIKLHHEKPNGRGYFSKMNKEKDAAIVNIADEFVGLASSNLFRPHYVKTVAIEKTMEHYLTARTMFNETELAKIKTSLGKFYHVIQK